MISLPFLCGVVLRAREGGGKKPRRSAPLETRQFRAVSPRLGSTPRNRDEDGWGLKSAGPPSIPPGMIVKSCPVRITDGPAGPILPQPRLPRPGATRPRQHPHAQQEGAALPLHYLRTPLRRDPRHAVLSPQEGRRHGGPSADLARSRLPPASDRRGLRARRADRRRLAGPSRPAWAALPRASCPERAGRTGPRPGRRVVRQGGRPAAPAGDGHGRPVAALAGGGVISPRRDLTLIMTLVRMVRRAARSLALLVCVDGLASYVTAFARVSRDPIRARRAGRPRLVPTAGLLLGQVIKHHAGRRLVSITRRVVRGSAGAIAAVLAATGTGTGIDTAYIERLNATF